MTPEELRKAWPEVERNLRAGDILMIHARKDWVGKNIRKAVGSHWNHTALVFMAKNDLPVGGPLLVEASYGGIEIHQMKLYSDHFDEYDIGVMRYPHMTAEQRESIVMDFVLSNLDADYDYSRLLGFFMSPIIGRISISLWSQMYQKMTHRQRFICSTFVHRAFHELSRHERVAHFVNVDDAAVNEMQFEENVTTRDIAREPIFEWVFNKRE